MEDILVPMSHLIVATNSFSQKVESMRDADGKFRPQARVARPSIIPGSGSPMIFLQVYGMAEYIDRKGEKQMLAIVSWPLGAGKSSVSADNLLEALLRMTLTIERTAYGKETIILRATGNEGDLKPWESIMKRGAAYPASKVCPSSTRIPVDRKVMFRPIHLDVTVLTSSKNHIARMTTRGFKTDAAVAVNLRVVLAVDKKIRDKGIKTSPMPAPPNAEPGNAIVDFILHLCLLKQSKLKTYNSDYAKKKLDQMQIEVSMGYVGGISIHVTVTGRMTKTMRASMGGSRQQVYSLMDVQPQLNAGLWLDKCDIVEVYGLIQASDVGEFRYFPSVCSKLGKGAIKGHKSS
ncbi:matrix protein [Hippocampus erectus paramyxovirus 1]|nr:matrix protein [Hippocampus erectus paramyxovirus 1]